MKHIFLFNKKSQASKSGIGTYIQQLKEIILQMNDIKLNIVNYDTDVQEFEFINEDSFNIFNFPSAYRAQIWNKNKYLRNLWYILFPYIEIKENDKYIFHFNYCEDVYLLPLLKDKIPSAKTIYTIHYLDWGLLLEGNVNSFKAIIHSDEIIRNKFENNILNLYHRDKDIFEKVDHIISLCNYTKDLLLNIYHIHPEKISLIPNGLKDEAKEISLKEKKMIKKEWNFSYDKNILLFVGRLEKLKGLDELIEAFKILINFDLNLHLVIVGEGEYSKYICQSRKYTSKISFLGRLSKEEIYQLYQIANIGILPSKVEQCSYVAIEMMMFGLSIVGSSSTGLKEIFNAEKIVKVSEKDGDMCISAQELADKIKYCLESNDNESRKIYELKYTQKIMYKNMYNLYHKL